MTKKLKFRFLLWYLVCLFGLISLVGCSSNDEEDGTYLGLIEHYDSDTEKFTIRVVNSPLEIGTDMPRNWDLLYVNSGNFAEMNLKENKKIRFPILSAENRPNIAIYDWAVWVCKIKIIKVY